MQGYFRDDAPLYELVLDDVGPPRARCALVRARFRDRGPDAPVSRLHLLRTRRAAAVHAGGPVRLRPLRGQGLHLRGQDDADCGAAYLAKARKNGANARAVEAIETYFADDVRADPPGRAGPPGRRAEPPRGPREVRRAGLSPAARRARARRPARVLPRVARAGRAGPRGRDPRRGRQRPAVAALLLPRSIRPGRASRSGRSPTTPWPAG